MPVPRKTRSAPRINNGWRDLVASYGGPQAYGHVFNGQWGKLDHALATPTLTLGQMAGATHWHINADEPGVLDYNVHFKTANFVIALSATDAMRNSNHDQAVVTLNLTAPVVVRGTAGKNVPCAGAGEAALIGGPGRDVLRGGSGRNQLVDTSVLDGGDTITNFRAGRDSLVLSGLLRSLSAPTNALASGHVRCAKLGTDALASVDPDGSAGPAPRRPLVLLRKLDCAALGNLDNLRL